MKLTVCIAAFILSGASSALAATAKESFDQGQALVAKGDFAAALDPLSAATKAEPANADYAKRFAAITKVVEYSKQMEAEADAKKYFEYGRALRAFFLREKLNDQAVALASKVHAKLNTPASATFYAETLLGCDKNEEAVKLLLSLPADKMSVGAKALLAIAYTEVKKPEEAKKVLADLQVPADALPGAKYMVARAYGKLGDAPKAIAMLKTFFEAVPPTQLDQIKAQAKALPEFAAFAATPEFAEVLKTESKIKMSDCTSGADCKTCPVGAKCPTSKEEKK